MTEVYKAVFQLPDDPVWRECLVDELRWQEGTDPHGPHIKIYPEKRDPETDEPCVHVRCKHHSLEDLRRLMNRVFDAIEEASR